MFNNYDNPPEIPDIIRYSPDSIYGSILVTSRSALSKELGEVIELDRMEQDEGLEPLRHHTSQADETDVVIIEKILARLEYLPLAIDQVPANISNQRLSLVGFRERVRKAETKFHEGNTTNTAIPPWDGEENFSESVDYMGVFVQAT